MKKPTEIKTVKILNGPTVYRVEIDLKLLPGEKCVVRNYRRKPADWEIGTVRSVKTGFRPDGSYNNAYEVLLDRKSTGRRRMFYEGGGPLFVTVGDEAISKTI